MNKFWAMILALLLATSPIALAESEQDATDDDVVIPSSTPAPYDLPACFPLGEFNAPEAADPFNVDGDMGIAIGDNWYPIMRDFSALKEVLGEPQDIVLTDSIIHPDYYDKEFIYDFGSVYTHPVDGVDIWYEIFVDGEDMDTSRGIKIGSTPDEVLAAYGEEYYEESATIYVYSLSGKEQDYATPSITIEAINNGVIYFDIYYPVFESFDE